jgi:hypothetical protein
MVPKVIAIHLGLARTRPERKCWNRLERCHRSKATYQEDESRTGAHRVEAYSRLGISLDVVCLGRETPSSGEHANPAEPARGISLAFLLFSATVCDRRSFSAIGCRFNDLNRRSQAARFVFENGSIFRLQCSALLHGQRKRRPMKPTRNTSHI